MCVHCVHLFHDILAGTSLRQACEDAYRSYEESLPIAGEALEHALTAIAGQVDTQRMNCIRGAGRPLLVFNPAAWVQTVPVETTVPVTTHWNEDWGGQYRPGAIRLTDNRGNPVPCQATALEHDGGRYWMHFCFLAELPALGYRCYHLSFPEDAAPPALAAWDPPVGAGFIPPCPPTIENEHLRLSFDPESGWLTGLYDLDRGVEVLRDPGDVPVALNSYTRPTHTPAPGLLRRHWPIASPATWS